MADSDILRGAIQAAAGQTLGLSPDQVLALKYQQVREEQRRKRPPLAERAGNRLPKADESTKYDEVADSLLGKKETFQSIGKYQEQERYPDPFGIPRAANDGESIDYDERQRGYEQERGGYVIVDRGKGKERLWRERGKLYSSPKFAQNKKPDFAEGRSDIFTAPPDAGMGGPNGLATQLADKVARGELNANDLVPGTSNKTIGALITEMAEAADPQLLLEKDRREATKARNGLTAEEIQGRAEREARIIASPQGSNIRGESTTDPGTIGADLSEAEVNAIRTEAIARGLGSSSVTPGGPARGFDAALEAEVTPIIAERITRSNAVNPEAQALTEERNAREAALLQTEFGGRRQTGQESLAQIGNIQNLGIATKKFERGANGALFSVTPNAVDDTSIDIDGGLNQMIDVDVDDASGSARSGDFVIAPGRDSYAVQMIGPDGQTVGYADGRGHRLADRVNFIGDENYEPSSISNAPVSKTATWMEGNLPDYGRPGGTSFGARNINPGDELAMLNERLGQFGSPRGIRGIDDLEQAVRAVTVDAAFAGRAMWNYDQETGKKIAARNPGIDEVLYGLDYTQDEKARLAAALQSVELAKRSPVNSLQKALFEEGIPSESNSKVTNNYDITPQMARITSERVGRDNKKTGEKRTSVRKGLRDLDGSTEVFKDRDLSKNPVYSEVPYDITDRDDNGRIIGEYKKGQRVMLPEAQQDLIDARQALGDAQRPFQGVRQGETAERPQFLGRNAVSMSPERRVEAYGSEMGGIANNVEARKIAAEAAQREAAQKPDPIAVEARRRDQDFEVAGLVRNAADNDREINEARKRMGVSLEGRGQMLLGGQIVPDSRPASADVPDRNVVPQGPLQAGVTIDARKLMDFTTRQATSAVTNSAPDPIPLAARGGWMGDPGQGRVVNPWDPETASAVAAQKAKTTQEPLAGITYNETAPDPWSQPVGTGNGISQEVAKRSGGNVQKALPYGLSSSGPTQGPTQAPGPKRARSMQERASFASNKIKGYATSPRHQTGRRRAYGVGAGVAGIAGLSSLIGGERDRRNEEAQY